MTRIVCTADLHENLIEIPECDLLLIAGDISYAFKGDLAAKQAFLAGEFREWLAQIPATGPEHAPDLASSIVSAFSDREQARPPFRRLISAGGRA